MIYESGLTVQDKVSSLFQSDPSLPYQYFETFRRKSYLAPEKRLVLAVLEDGIICFQKFLVARHSKGKRLFREAEDWILEEGSEWLFSFENVCEILGFEPSYIRGALMRWKERSLTQSLEAKHPLTREKIKKECKRKNLKLPPNTLPANSSLSAAT